MIRLALLTFALPVLAAGPAPADLVLENGAVYTVDAARSWSEAVAVAGGRIVYVGSTAGARAHVGPTTRGVDLGGRLLLPGFIDSHSHPTGAVTRAVSVYLFDGKTREDYLKTIREYVQKHPGQAVVRGSGWSNTSFPPTGPRKEDLDAIVRDVPAAFSSEDGHSTWCNSKALALGGVTRDTPNPPAGVVEKDPKTGEPTGTLRESAASLVRSKLPPYTVEEMTAGLELFQKMAAEAGVTSVHIASTGIGDSAMKAFEAVEAKGGLTVRFRGALTLGPDEGEAGIAALVAERARHKGPLYQLGAVKIFADGVVEGGTAYLLEPYLHKPGFRGEPRWEPELMKRVFTRLDKEGFQIHVHSIGDAATRETLDSLAAARAANGPRDRRSMLTHIQLVDRPDFARFRELGAIAVPQPFWFQKGAYYDNLEVPYLGHARADHEYPMKSFFDAGVVVASASDFPVTPDFSPIVGIDHGVRRSEDGRFAADDVLAPEERVSLDQMIASFTINGAYASFLEQETGSIEVGKSADLVVLDRNLFAGPASEIAKAKVLLTLFQGKEVFRAAGAPAWASAPAATPRKPINVTVLYPQTAGSHFDMAYYLAKHIPLLHARLEPALRDVRVEQGVAGREPGSPAAFAVICHLTFDSLEPYQQAFAPYAAEIVGDLANFTDITPTVQISEVR